MNEIMEDFKNFKRNRFIFLLITFFICAMILLIYLANKKSDYDSKVLELKKNEIGLKLRSEASYAYVEFEYHISTLTDLYITKSKAELNSSDDFTRTYEKAIAAQKRFEELARKNNLAKEKSATLIKGKKYKRLCEDIKSFESTYNQLKNK